MIEAKLDQFQLRPDEVITTTVNSELYRILDNLSKPLTRLASEISAIKHNLEEKDRMMLFKWLSVVPYTKHHRTKVKERLPDSGQWLLRRPVVIDWMRQRNSSILWLHGIPGSGKKSMLVACVIEHIRTSGELVARPAPIAYFYFARDINEPERS